MIPPNSKTKVTTTKIVASAGGRWMTTPNGFTFLNKPSLTICLDYGKTEHHGKSGNRIWTIKKAEGFEPGCKIEGYKQPWYQPSR